MKFIRYDRISKIFPCLKIHKKGYSKITMNSTTDIYFKRWKQMLWSNANYFCSNDDTSLPELNEFNSFDLTNEMVSAFNDSSNSFWDTIWERNEKIIRIEDSRL